jgi:homospermidine synthase
MDLATEVQSDASTQSKVHNIHRNALRRLLSPYILDVQVQGTCIHLHLDIHRTHHIYLHHHSSNIFL